MRTPWGAAQHVQPLAEGIAFVSTPRHGGVHLSPERKEQMPADLRRTWFEEDCEAALPLWWFRSLIPTPSHMEADKYLAELVLSIHHWNPEHVDALLAPAKAEAQAIAKARGK